MPRRFSCLLLLLFLPRRVADNAKQGALPKAWAVHALGLAMMGVERCHWIALGNRLLRARLF